MRIIAFILTYNIITVTVWVRDLTTEGIHPNPGPPLKKINILSINVGGARSKHTKWKYRKLIEFAKSEKYHIIMIQETRSPDINYIHKSVADIPQKMAGKNNKM